MLTDDYWSTLGGLVGVVSLWTVVFIFAVKFMLGSQKENFDTQMKSLKDLLEASSSKQHELEKSILELRVELAKNYVHRNDWLRALAVLNRRFDLIFDALDKQKGNDHVT
ncbi:MAG: hypothetical protein P1V51_24485 [Deltaproteobacteria bacterium]|nr:hypothetical protein [Deltaproteobacteria bacterium]